MIYFSENMSGYARDITFVTKCVFEHRMTVMSHRIVASSSFRVQKKGSTYIPDPSKFFGDLNSSHGGNFTVSPVHQIIRHTLAFVLFCLS